MDRRHRRPASNRIAADRRRSDHHHPSAAVSGSGHRWLHVRRFLPPALRVVVSRIATQRLPRAAVERGGRRRRIEHRGRHPGRCLVCGRLRRLEPIPFTDPLLAQPRVPAGDALGYRPATGRARLVDRCADPPHARARRRRRPAHCGRSRSCDSKWSWSSWHRGGASWSIRTGGAAPSRGSVWCSGAMSPPTGEFQSGCSTSSKPKPSMSCSAKSQCSPRSASAWASHSERQGLRRYGWLCGFHISIEIVASVQVFSYAALAALVIWVTPRGRDRVVELRGEGRAASSLGWALRRLDWTGRFRIVRPDDPGPGITPA